MAYDCGREDSNGIVVAPPEGRNKTSFCAGKETSPDRSGSWRIIRITPKN